MELKGITATLACIAAFAAGCYNNSTLLEKQLNTLGSQLEEIRKSNSSMRLKIDDLENRVLLLQDEIYTMKLAKAKKTENPELPVVKLSPAPEPDDYEEYAGYSDFDSVVFKNIDENGNVVEFSGDAGSIGKSASPVTSPEVELLAKGEKLKVVPVEKAKVQKGAQTDKKEVGQDNESAVLNEYKEAYELYQDGDSRSALVKFRDFLEKNPNHPYSDNARYWIGECYYDMRDYVSAREEFKKVINDYPDGNKVPDAMLKLALSSQMLKLFEEAKEMYTNILLSYPSTPAAEIAMVKIKEIP
ncbi:MAG: tol-pal system protein YbgF [Deltaproteobacteria bacterium]|nr:tol-pal system protein YbgF [Deltaproteobacteria bacterium]